MIISSYSAPVCATSLDEIYRDIVRNDNQGYLPIFVKNRKHPELLFDDDLTKQNSSEVKVIQETPLVQLVDERKIREEKRLAELKRWNDAVAAIKENRVTPAELEQIDRYANNNDPKAIEIKAWMYAKGIGINQDLVEAFNLYRKAGELGISTATKNAAEVYRSMNREQRESLTPFKK